MSRPLPESIGGWEEGFVDEIHFSYRRVILMVISRPSF